MLDKLYEIQKHLLNEMPQEGTEIRKALDKIDELIQELESEE